MVCSYKPPYRRPLRLKAFLAHLQTWDTINPTNKRPPKRLARRAFLNATYQLNARRMARVALSRKSRRRAICTM
jgi:hypothetical protein